MAAPTPTLTGAGFEAMTKAGTLEVVAPIRDPAGLAPRLREAFHRQGFDVGTVTPAPGVLMQSAPATWPSQTRSPMSAWSLHFVPLYHGADSRPAPGAAGRGSQTMRAVQRVRVHFDYDTEAAATTATLTRLSATLIDADAGTVVGHLAFSGQRSADGVLGDLAQLVPGPRP